MFCENTWSSLDNYVTYSVVDYGIQLLHSTPHLIGLTCEGSEGILIHISVTNMNEKKIMKQSGQNGSDNRKKNIYFTGLYILHNRSRHKTCYRHVNLEVFISLYLSQTNHMGRLSYHHIGYRHVIDADCHTIIHFTNLTNLQIAIRPYLTVNRYTPVCQWLTMAESCHMDVDTCGFRLFWKVHQ